MQRAHWWLRVTVLNMQTHRISLQEWKSSRHQGMVTIHSFSSSPHWDAECTYVRWPVRHEDGRLLRWDGNKSKSMVLFSLAHVLTLWVVSDMSSILFPWMRRVIPEETMTSPQGKANQEAHMPLFSYPLEVLATSTEAWSSVTSQMGLQELGVFDPFSGSSHE